MGLIYVSLEKVSVFSQVPTDTTVCPGVRKILHLHHLTAVTLQRYGGFGLGERS